MTPLQAAALDAWDEAARMREELTTTALPLRDESSSLNRAAWETFRAWERAVERAHQVQQLADDDAGVFNAFEQDHYSFE